MENKRIIFDLLVQTFADQQRAYGDIDELFGTTGTVSSIIDGTLARLEDAIMLFLGWHIELITVDDIGYEGKAWVKDDLKVSTDYISDWFSIFGMTEDYDKRMDIIFDMSEGDRLAYEYFSSAIASYSSSELFLD